MCSKVTAKQKKTPIQETEVLNRRSKWSKSHKEAVERVGSEASFVHPIAAKAVARRARIAKR